MESKWVLCWIAVTAAVFMVSGILIGYYGINPSSAPREPLDVKLVVDEVTAEKISSNLRHLTSVPHVAGTVRDREQAEWLKDRFLESGLDEAKTASYEVLLSYPHSDGVVNRVSLIDDVGNVQFETVGRQTPLGSPEESSDEVQVNFNAYSGNGVVEGDIVYAYYGREEDYDYLASRNINISGKIVLVRYGAVFRGAKVQVAENLGAIGVILFSDPQDKAAEGRDFSYPDSWWMPGMGVELGTVYNGNGDPLTPFYPALASAYGRKEEDTPTLPRIPVQPIGYDEAEILLQNIANDNPGKSDWIGHLNATYNLGPKLINPNWKVRLNVSTTNQKRTIYNTIGILRGSEEPDRYVLLGNHRDSWTFGALDPSSGTASLVEIVRAFGKLKNDRNWRPRRTLVFCSWGAEEYGLIGSTEWMEQHFKVLSQRAVAYLNVDVAVGGNKTLYADAYPTLKQLLIEMSKLVPNPSSVEIAAGHTKVFDTWLANNPDPENPSQPSVGNLGGGSDFEAFAYVVGMPVTDFGYTAPRAYPTYHTLYDSYLLASEIIDRGFVHHQAVARMWAAVAVQLADSVIIPYDIRAYALFLNRSLSSLETQYGALLQINNDSFDYIRASANYFSEAVETFLVTTLETLDKTDLLAVRRANDRLMNLERFFVDPRGLPDRPETNHIVFSVSVSNSYASDTFAGLVDLFTKVGNQTEIEDSETWAKIHQHMSVIAFLIGEAARSLNEDF